MAFKARLVVTSDVFDFKSNAACAAVLIGLNKSVVLFTFPNPTIELVIPLTVPVNVGEARFAFKASEVVTSEAFDFKSILFDKVLVSAIFNFNPKLVLTSDVFAFKASEVVTSEAFDFKSILFDNVLVSALFNFNDRLVATSVAFDFKSNAVCVKLLIGLSVSDVLFILSMANDVFKPAKLFTPVPPNVTGTIPTNLSASTPLAYCA